MSGSVSVIQLDTCTGTQSNRAIYPVTTQKICYAPGGGVLFAYLYTADLPVGATDKHIAIGYWRLQQCPVGQDPTVAANWRIVYDSQTDAVQVSCLALETDDSGNAYVFASVPAGGTTHFWVFTNASGSYATHTHSTFALGTTFFGAQYDRFRKNLTLQLAGSASPDYYTLTPAGATVNSATLYKATTSGGDAMDAVYPAIAQGTGGLNVVAWSVQDMTLAFANNFYSSNFLTTVKPFATGNPWYGKSGLVTIPIANDFSGPSWMIPETVDQNEFVPVGAPASPFVRVQGSIPVTATTSGTSISISLASNTTIGNHIVVVIGYSGTPLVSIASVTDTAGNSYTVHVDQDNGDPTGSSTAIASCQVTKQLLSTGKITATTTGTGDTYRFIWAAEYSGGATNWFDVAAGGTGTGTAAASGAISPAQTGELLIGAATVAGNVTITPTTPGASQRQDVQYGTKTTAVNEYNPDATTAAIQDANTLSASATWTDVVCAFQPAGGYGGNVNFLAALAYNNGYLNFLYGGTQPSPHVSLAQFNYANNVFTTRQTPQLEQLGKNVTGGFSQDQTLTGILYLTSWRPSGTNAVVVTQQSTDGGATWTDWAISQWNDGGAGIPHIGTGRWTDPAGYLYGCLAYGGSLGSSSSTTAAVMAVIVTVPGVAPPPPVAPSNTALPTITGTPQQGQTLTASTGSWSGTTPITYSYAWSDGVTGSSDVLGASDVGSLVSVTVTATNAAGSASQASTQVGPVSASPVTVGTAFPNTQLRDNFNYTANPLKAPWVTGAFSAGGLEANGTLAFTAVSSGAGGGMWTGIPIMTPPVEVWVTLAQTMTSASTSADLLWGNEGALVGDSTFYGYRASCSNINGGAVTITRIAAGIVTTLGSFSSLGQFVAGNSIGMSIDGSGNITVYREQAATWSEIASAVDGNPLFQQSLAPSAPLQYIGMSTNDGGVRFENFGGGSLAFPTTPILDNFNYTANPLGTNWSDGLGTLVPLQANGSQALATPFSAGGGAATLWVYTLFQAPPVEVFATLTQIPATSTNNVSLYWTNATIVDSRFYQYRIGFSNASGGTVTIVTRTQGAAEVTLANVTGVGTFVAGDTIGVRFDASGFITVFLEHLGQWQVLTSFTDPNPLWIQGTNVMNYIGIGTNDASTLLDDFGGGGAAATPPAPNPLTRVQQAAPVTTTSASGSFTISLPLNTMVNTHLVVVIGYSGNASTHVSSVTDTAGNVYTVHVDQNNGGATGASTAIASCQVNNQLLSTGAITVTTSATAANMFLWVAEYTGGSNVWFDAAGGATGSGTQTASPIVTPQQAGDLIISAASVTSGSETFTPFAPFTQLSAASYGTNGTCVNEYNPASTAGVQDSNTLPTSTTWTDVTVAFTATQTTGGGPGTTAGWILPHIDTTVTV